jgi:hypothetical protein
MSTHKCLIKLWIHPRLQCGNKTLIKKLYLYFKIKYWPLEMSSLIVVNIITFIDNIVTNGIYDYAIFVSSGKYDMNVWTIKSCRHGQSYMCFRTTMLVAYVLIFIMFWHNDTWTFLWSILKFTWNLKTFGVSLSNK